MSGDQIPGTGHIGYPADPLDSFARLKVAHPLALFDAQFNYGLQPSLFEQYVVNGSITHVPSHSAVRLSTGGTTIGNKAIFQSWKYFRYQPGKAQEIIWTCVLGAPATGVRKIIGLIDDEDGLAFIQNGSQLGVLRRTSTSGVPVDNVVWQSGWNLDKLDGTGKSEVTLDVAKNNIFVIDEQWLGAGRPRWGVDVGGHITYVHQLQFANTDVVPFTRTANLPFRAEIENVGAADSATEYDFTCVAINSSAGSEPVGLTLSTSNDQVSGGTAPLKLIDGVNIPVLSIRPKTTFNGLIYRGQTIPVSCQISSRDAPIAYKVIRNGVLTGASFADVDVTNSSVEADVSATAIAGGVVVASGYLGAGAGMQAMGTTTHELDTGSLSNNIAGDETEILTLVISRADGVSSNCAGAFTWKELR